MHALIQVQPSLANQPLFLMKEGLACETKYNRVHATNLHAAQVLAHYLMIDPLSGIADYVNRQL